MITPDKVDEVRQLNYISVPTSRVVQFRGNAVFYRFYRFINEGHCFRKTAASYHTNIMNLITKITAV